MRTAGGHDHPPHRLPTIGLLGSVEVVGRHGTSIHRHWAGVPLDVARRGLQVKDGGWEGAVAHARTRRRRLANGPAATSWNVKGATEAQSFTLVAEDALWFLATGGLRRHPVAAPPRMSEPGRASVSSPAATTVWPATMVST